MAQIPCCADFLTFGLQYTTNDKTDSNTCIVDELDHAAGSNTRSNKHKQWIHCKTINNIYYNNIYNI